MTIREALNLGYKKTKSTLDAEVLLSYALQKPKEYIYSNPAERLRIPKLRVYRSLIRKRQAGWPVAYLTGEKEFYGLKFKVTPDVLIPRPETETIVELVGNSLPLVGRAREGVKILDVGTGSGCIIISLAKSLRGGKFSFFASDISSKALAVAKFNARKHKVKIKFKQGDLLKPWKNQKFDIIVANLPYGWKAWKNNSSAATVGLKFEPQQALYTKGNGLFLIEKLLKQIYTLNPGPSTLFLEFDPRQTTTLKSLAKKILPRWQVKIHKDLSGRNRIAEIG